MHDRAPSLLLAFVADPPTLRNYRSHKIHIPRGGGAGTFRLGKLLGSSDE